MELEKNSEWRLYILEEYRVLAKQKECTDSHNKYYGNIINSIKEKEEKQIFHVKQEPKRKRPQEEEEEMVRCTNCNLHYLRIQRHNCQRGFREGEQDQIKRRYQRTGDRSSMRNRKYNRRRSQMEGQPRHENH
jgi:hypothetical protein